MKGYPGGIQVWAESGLPVEGTRLSKSRVKPAVSDCRESNPVDVSKDGELIIKG